jgi:uncharacterized radical SAM superfamily Fe-S cluster-containing enzyme
MPLRDYRFLGTTQSLCPECLALVPAKIISRRDRVYFLKHCPRHGRREDFVCSDVRFYDRLEYTVPARSPVLFGTRSDRGCPFDCGLCTEHEQHTCIGLVELTSSCNLTCPMCYASSSPGGRHVPLEECQQAIDRLVEVEGRPEVLQLSGGEPTLHPQFSEVLDYALSRPIDYVQINTNGIRLAHDAQLIQSLARHRQRLEFFFQLDGLNDDVALRLRGERLLDVKLRALEQLGQADLHVTLAVTLQGGVNDDQLGPLVQFAIQRPWITGINFQPATYSGRHFLPEQLEDRITFPDVIQGISRQTGGIFREDDFLPLPCAHPNCHSIALAWRSHGSVVPLTRFIDARENLDLLANGIGFTRPQARNLILQYLGRQGCCGGHCATGDSPPGALPVLSANSTNGSSTVSQVEEFFAGVLNEQLGAADLFRITITSFLDAYNFDVRRLMKCCTHHILPSGHVIPFCAYNTLYRPGHLPLPVLAGTSSEYAAR